MKKSEFWILPIIIHLSINVGAQQKRTFKVHTLAFYNVENLFDTINDPKKLDEISPIMEIKFNRSPIYKKKIKNIARVISEVGADVSNNTPALIGLAEIENRQVLEDLANDPSLFKKNYGIAHYDSPDVRGIDVALLYQKELFVPMNISKHELRIYDDNTGKRIYTRDQLLVSGKLENELIHIIVNHWPSRRGGEARSRPKRIAAARLNKKIIDSLQAINPYAKVLTMGDLNDDPTNSSLKEVLKAKKDRENVKLKGLYNPMEVLFKKGLGTIAYRETWSLFDQILITKPLLENDYSTFRFYKAGIFNKHYLTTKKGKYKGYPFRSFTNGGFSNGFSDHYPVFIHVIKEVHQISKD